MGNLMGEISFFYYDSAVRMRSFSFSWPRNKIEINNIWGQKDDYIKAAIYKQSQDVTFFIV